MKVKYEYNIEACPYFGNDIYGKTEYLNKHAQNGWELVGIDPSSCEIKNGFLYGKPLYIFRRLIKLCTPDQANAQIYVEK